MAERDAQHQALAARARFEEIAAGPDAALDLGEAALWLAAEAYPGLDVPAALSQLDTLALPLRAAVSRAVSLREKVELVNSELFERQGFRGIRDDYYDPRNSFLNEVLERRTGIPIALCVIYVEVARRAGLDARGISFPGHFLAKVVSTDEEIIVDAFEARTVAREECERRLRTIFGPQAVLTDEMLRAATHREILLRMLANLKSIYMSRNEYEAAVACCDRSLLLAESAIEYRDRGLLYQQLECTRAALLDLTRYLSLAPDHEGAEAIRKLVGVLRERVPPLH